MQSSKADMLLGILEKLYGNTAICYANPELQGPTQSPAKIRRVPLHRLRIDSAHGTVRELNQSDCPGSNNPIDAITANAQK
jgi:hypothetical protein